MKIGNPTDKTVGAPAPVAPGRTATPAGAKPQTVAAPEIPVEASSQVALSSAATQLLSGTDAVAGDFDAEKVARISQAIAEGKFQVNAGAIADKLLANARELLGKPQH